MAEANHIYKFFGWRYALGSLFLVLANIFFSFLAGSRLGYEDYHLLGYSFGFLFIVLLVVGLSRLIRSARTKSATAKIVFFTLLITLFGAFSGLMRGEAKLESLATEIDPESLMIDEQNATALALHIQDSVSKGQVEELESLFAADRFMKKALRGSDTTSRKLRDFVRGGSESFKNSILLEQMGALLKEGGEFSFVKLYRKDREPILQYRLTEASGNLHYLDFYLFKTADGNIRIDDFRYYNSGELLSRQIIENASLLDNKSSSSSSNFEALQKAVQLSQQGRIEEAYSLLASLPDDLKQQKAVMRLRIQWGFQVDMEKAEQLLTEFKKNFPDDPGIVFSAFTSAIFRDDPSTAAALIDDIYKAVDGDEYLLWYKTNLFLAQKKYQEATSLLSEMESKYKIDVRSVAEDMLLEEFLSSKEYKSWRSRPGTVK